MFLCRNKPPSCKNSFSTPKQSPLVEDVKISKNTEIKYSTSDKRKCIDSGVLQENIKHREKVANKTKEKTNTKTSKLLKLEKKDKNKSQNESGKHAKTTKKEKKVDKKAIKMKWWAGVESGSV